MHARLGQLEAKQTSIEGEEEAEDMQVDAGCVHTCGGEKLRAEDLDAQAMEADLLYELDLCESSERARECPASHLMKCRLRLGPDSRTQY